MLFASTRPLTEFATRQSDSAAICTIINNSNNSSSNSNSNHISNSAGKEEEEEQKGGEETKTKSNSNSNNNSILLSNAIAIERKEKEKGKEKEEEDFPCLILKLDDGFEKRYPVQCPRCGVCFGYQLDGSQWVEDGNEKEKEKEKEKDDDVRRTGRRCDVLYVLREGLVRTEDVAVGGGGDGS